MRNTDSYSNLAAMNNDASPNVPPAEPGPFIASEILRIMATYHEQENAGGVDTPGGLEHIGDVWRLFKKWESMLLAPPTASPSVASDSELMDYLETRLVDTIYFDDQTILDVGGKTTLREAIAREKSKGSEGRAV